MNAYIWRTGESLIHHIRAESVSDVRERIAATRGDDIAQQAVITSLETARTNTSNCAAA